MPPAAARHVTWIPHSRPVRSLFKPLPELLDASDGCASRLASARAELRASFGMPRDAFVIVLAGSGSEASDRKAFCNQIEACARFMQERDLDPRAPPSFLYIHTETLRFNDIPKFLAMFGEMPGRAVDFRSPAGHSRFDPTRPTVGPRVRVVAQDASLANSFMACSDERICDMYRAADVVCHATKSEGCGVGLLEAQSCGTPVVTTQNTAMTELTELGVSVPPAHYCPRQDFNSGWGEPDVRGVTRALHEVAGWTAAERVAKTLSALAYTQRAWSDELQEARWTALLADVEADVLRPLKLPPAERAAWTCTKIRVPPTRWLQLCAYAELRKALPEEQALRTECTAMTLERDAQRQLLLQLQGTLNGIQASRAIEEGGLGFSESP